MVAASAVIAGLSLAACSRGHHTDAEATPPTAASTCPQPAQGARFSLCGTIASARPQGETESGRSLSGSLDSMPQLTGKRFVMKGGTLNAIR
jgi:hypothetical protein